MSYLDDQILIDLLSHGPQRLDDLEALARYAVAAGSPNCLTALWALSRAVTEGNGDLSIPQSAALAIHHLHTDRVNRLAALIQDGYAAIEQLSSNPGSATIVITARGTDAACGGLAAATRHHQTP